MKDNAKGALVVTVAWDEFRLVFVSFKNTLCSGIIPETTASTTMPFLL
ncbi:MAG: hypothetical protein OXF29_02555 [Hyphomicrobiales bacterium]|nr:hypothetical protein [Hyphomicrobiales bacterium]